MSGKVRSQQCGWQKEGEKERRKEHTMGHRHVHMGQLLPWLHRTHAPAPCNAEVQQTRSFSEFETVLLRT